MVSVSMLLKIFIKTSNTQSNKNQENIVVPVLPNGHSSRRPWHATSISWWSNASLLVCRTLSSTIPFALFLVAATPTFCAVVRTDASTVSNVGATFPTFPTFPTMLEGSTRAVKACRVSVFVHCTLTVNNLQKRNKKMHDLRPIKQSILRFVHQSSMHDVDVQLKKRKRTAKDPKTMIGIKTIII